MANKIYDRDFSLNQALVLSELMKFDSLPLHIWGRLAKFNTPDGVAVSPSQQPEVTEAVVVIQNELTKKQGDVMKIPMHRQLVQFPRTGRQQMAGFEEEPKVNVMQIPIDIQRHAEKPKDGTMSVQTAKELDLIKNARPALLNHYAQVEELLGCTYAMYNGFSYNILNSSRFSGHSTITAISHPNVFVAGTGKIPTTTNYPGTAAYSQAIATAIDNIGVSHIFDTDFLRGLKSYRAIQAIPPVIMKDGNKLRLIFAHPYQIATLENDDLFNVSAASIYAQSAQRDNPMLFGVKYVWAGFAIFETDTAVWPVSTSGGLPVWGVASPDSLDDFENYSSYTKFAGMVLGPGTLYKAFGSRFEFKERVDDYDEIYGVAYRVVEGYGRGEYWNDDDGTRGQYLVNKSSAIFITYAAAPTM